MLAIGLTSARGVDPAARRRSLGWALLTATTIVGYARERGLVPRAAGIASLLAYGLALWAMTRGPVALVAALRETSVLIALLIARAMLGERVGTRRWAGAASIVAGRRGPQLARTPE